MNHPSSSPAASIVSSAPSPTSSFSSLDLSPPSSPEKDDDIEMFDAAAKGNNRKQQQKTSANKRHQNQQQQSSSSYGCAGPAPDGSWDWRLISDPLLLLLSSADCNKNAKYQFYRAAAGAEEETGGEQVMSNIFILYL